MVVVSLGLVFGTYDDGLVAQPAYGGYVDGFHDSPFPPKGVESRLF
jgi:hypothetical protein